MATRGIYQLQKLTINYCEYGGSSSVIRDYLASGKIIDWAKERSHLQIDVKVNNGNHPYIKGDYISSTSKKFNTKYNKNLNPNIHQICIKSNKSNKPDIEKVLNTLYNRSGRKITKFTKAIYTDTPSIQGRWTPTLNLHLQPEFPITYVNEE